MINKAKLKFDFSRVQAGHSHAYDHPKQEYGKDVESEGAVPANYRTKCAISTFTKSL